MDKKEIRAILSGRIVLLTDDIWTAAPSDVRLPFQSMSGGQGNARLFGFSTVERLYSAGDDVDSVFYKVAPILGALGRVIHIESEPRLAACLYRSFFSAPVLLTLDRVEKELLLTAYAGKGAFSKMYMNAAIDIFERRLPEGISLTKKQKEKKPKEKKAKKEKKNKKDKKI